MKKIKCFLLIALFIASFSLTISCHHPNAEAAVRWQFAYDEAERITKIVDPAGRETNIQRKFDEKGHLQELTRKLPDGSVTLRFDRFDRPIQMQDDLGTVDYEYDNFSRLTAVRREGQPDITYTYDTEDRIKSVKVGENRTSYTYDFLDRLTSMDTPVGRISYQYRTGEGKIIRTLPNGILTIWEFQPDGNLASLTHGKTDNYTGDNSSQSYRILAQFTYSYRPDGLISQIQEVSSQGQKTLSYEYDEVQRLISVNDSLQGKTEYRYDEIGDRIEIRKPAQETVASSYDWASRLVSYDGQECSHDAAGNLISCRSDSEQRQFNYDGSNLLAVVTGNSGKVEYQYDGDGNLLVRKVDGEETSFVTDPLSEIWRPLLVNDAQGQSTAYIWEGESPLATKQGSEEQFFLEDHLGSVRYVTDGQGNVVEQRNYEPFGESQAISNKELQPGFAGLFFDSNSDLYLTRARDYDPNLGQFLQPDPQHRIPLGSQKDFSSYLYSGADPVNFVDLDGFEPVAITFKNTYHPDTQWQQWKPRYLNKNAIEFASRKLRRMSYKLWLFRTSFKIDINYVKQFYAHKSERALISAEGGWKGISKAVLVATAFDFIGGFYPGEAANQRQELTSRLWNFVPVLGLARNAKFVVNAAQLARKPELITSLVGSIGTARTSISLPSNIYKGEYGLAAWDAVGLGGTTLSSLAGHFAKAGKFPKMAMRFNTASTSISLFELSRGAVKNFQEAFVDTGLLDYKDVTNMYLRSISPTSVFLNPIMKAMSPSNVGGIYLGGAGEAIKDLGQLSGIAIDPNNGELILLSEEQGDIELPPLRLDDVVTIFRSVYEQGTSPWVTIDPNPEDPRGSFMVIRHSPGTENTYVGWVLFEADRVMKAYSLGKDNVTNQPVKSSVPDYQNLLNQDFDNSDANNQASNWERFLIVPASVERNQTQDKKLTLLDVPMHLITQPMELFEGELKPAGNIFSCSNPENNDNEIENSTASEGAKAFTCWFTENYGAIAQENKVTPPTESGIEVSVFFYTEVQRLALISAIAETLHDQGVPFPTWMQNYQVKSVPVTSTTPTIVVESSQRTNQGTLTHSIYGGVELSPEDKDIYENLGVPEAEALEPELFEAISTKQPLTPVNFQNDNKSYQAVALPGNNTKDIAGKSLTEVDLVVPLQGDNSLSLVRQFHSFFQPSDIFGKGWTLDLPRLEEWRKPVSRVGNTTTYSTAYQLTSPLNSWSSNFIPEPETQSLVSDDPESILPLAVDNDSRIGIKTKLVRFRNGQHWHFDDSGNLVAWTQAPLMIIYRRDKANQITKIEGWYGQNLRGDIQLKYDAKNRLSSTKGSNGSVVTYSYNKAGQLAKVNYPQVSVGYSYDANGLVIAIQEAAIEEDKEDKEDSKKVRAFSYNKRGQLTSEWFNNDTEDGVTVEYTSRYTPQGIELTTQSSDQSQLINSVKYGAAFRPVHRTFADGTVVDWKYGNNGEVEIPITLPDGEKYLVTQSADGQHSELQLPEGGTYTAEYDANGHLTKLEEDNHLVLTQQWRENGQLAALDSETVSIRPEYSKDGLLTSLLVAAPEEESRSSFSRWVQTKYDQLGRILEMRDYSGTQTLVNYDSNDALTSISSNLGEVNMVRNNQGEVTEITTDWGYSQENTYDGENSELSKIQLSQAGEEATIEVDSGRVSKVRQFDGGELTFSYYDSEQHDGQVQEILTPNNLALWYDYDDGDRLARVQVGDKYRVDYKYDDQDRLVEITQTPSRK